MARIDRWMKRVKRSASGCWEWTGTRAMTGYGIVNIGGKMRGAHRAFYEALVGPIPDGLHIDHLCRVRHCVNPSHLEAVPQGVNTLRGVRAKRH